MLFVVSAFPRSADDVITPWMVETIRRLRDLGVNVEVLAPAYRGAGGGEVHGISVHRFRYAPRAFETLTHDQTAPDRIRERPLFSLLVPGYLTGGCLAAMRLARSGKYDVIHVFWPLPHGLIGLAGKLAGGIPLVTTFFGVELTWLAKGFSPFRPVVRWIVRTSDAVTTISRHTARLLEDCVRGANPETIPFGAAAPEPSERAVRPDERRQEGTFTVLFVGRLVERKGVHVLLEALHRLPPGSPVRAEIVGSGPEQDRLKSDIARLGLESRVEMTGAVSPEELGRRFSACDVFVLPAVRDAKGDEEGLGVVLLEALAHGKPVIASESGGITDIVIHERTGLLVAPNDPDALLSAIERIRRDPVTTKLLVHEGSAWLASQFSWDAITARLTRLYSNVVEARRQTR